MFFLVKKKNSQVWESHNEIESCHGQKELLHSQPRIHKSSMCMLSAYYPIHWWNLLPIEDKMSQKQVTQIANVLIRAYSCISKFMHTFPSTMHTSLHTIGFHIYHTLVPEEVLIYL